MTNTNYTDRKDIQALHDKNKRSTGRRHRAQGKSLLECGKRILTRGVLAAEGVGNAGDKVLSLMAAMAINEISINLQLAVIVKCGHVPPLKYPNLTTNGHGVPSLLCRPNNIMSVADGANEPGDGSARSGSRRRRRGGRRGRHRRRRRDRASWGAVGPNDSRALLEGTTLNEARDGNAGRADDDGRGWRRSRLVDGDRSERATYRLGGGRDDHWFCMMDRGER